MQKSYLISLLIFLISFNIKANEMKYENLLLLDCENVEFITSEYLYPIKINKLSSFKIKKDTEIIYQFDFKIRKNFKFPKIQNKEFIPIYDERINGRCYNDEIPKLMSHIYQELKDNKNVVSTYLHKEGNLYYLKINIK